MFRRSNLLNLPPDSGFGERKLGDHRRMIGRTFQSAWRLVHLTAFTDRRQRGADQNVVNPQAEIAPEGGRPIIPPAKGGFGVREEPEGVL